MAESFSVRAILSAQDKGFTSTLKSALGTTESLADKIKGGFAFGILTGAGQQAFSTLTNGARELVGEVNQSSKAWQTFEGNMKQFGKSRKEINKVKKSLQSYAETTVYSSSDMASTYAQLEAVGVGSMKSLSKGTEGLVKGFGGLSAAAEDPQQAMKSLSQQATQMAAKPKVAWEDFKIMLEQSPAGMAAVAKAMGMSTEQLISKIQAGEIKTEKFFAAVEKAGTSDGFQKMATEAKTMDQAIDGAKEALGNKLLPAFGVVTKVGIKAIDGIAAKIGEIDADKLADKVSAGIEAAQPYWEAFMAVLSGVGGYIKTVSAFLMEHKDTIAKYAPLVLKLVLAYKAFKVVNSLVPGMSKFTGCLTSLAGKGISALAGKLFGIAGGQKAVGTASQTSAGSTMAAAKAFLMMSAAVLLISAGFALLAQSAIGLASAGGPAIAVMFGLIAAVALLGVGMAVMLKTLAPMGAQLMPVATAMLVMGAAVLVVATGFAILAASSIMLANSGGLAIGIMVGMVAAIALLAVGAAALGPALTAGAVGFIAFGAAIALVGAGVLLASAGLALLATQLPTIAAYGTQSALAIAALGASMIVFAAGAITAGASLLVLSAGMLAFGASVIVASAGLLVFGVGMITGAAGTLVMVAALKAVNSSMKSISKNAKSTQKSLKGMRSAVKVVESGLDALGNKAKSAMKKLTSAFDNSATKAQTAGKKAGTGYTKALDAGLKPAPNKAKSAGQKVGNGFTTGMASGLAKATVVSSTATVTITSRLRAGRSGAYSAGAYISLGFAQGMRSQLSAIRSAASQMAAAADKALRAKAKIHSPSRVTKKDGRYWGQGLVVGMLDMYNDVKAAAKKLISIPVMNEPRLAFAGAYGGEMSADYEYYRNSQYNIEVVSTIDGREVARSSATYMQDELDKKQSRENRKHGRV